MRPALRLLALVACAWLARAVDGDPPPNQEQRPPSPIPDDMAAVTELVSDGQWAPLPECWEQNEVFQSTLFPGEMRYFARRWTSPTTSWIAPNSFTRGIPLPPTNRGPRPCGCHDLRGRATTIYGQQENARLWPWMADWYDPAHPHRPYAANVWNGVGPCARMGQLSVLHRFPSFLSAAGDTPWVWINENARREMEAHEALDEAMMPLLFTAEQRSVLPRVRRRVHEGAQQLTVLRARWAAWVYSLLERRARIIYELIGRRGFLALQTSHAARLAQLRDRRYFGGGPQGAWFDDVIRDADVIRRFIIEGVPVIYRWEVEYEALPFLADLAPPAGPAPNSPRRLPPPTPSRPRSNAPVRNHARHYDSFRIPPQWAVNEDGTPYVADDVDVHMLTPLDPDVRPPNRLRASERGESPISLGDESDSDSSMGVDDLSTTDGSSISPAPQTPRPPLALRITTPRANVDQQLTENQLHADTRARARTPESPLTGMQNRQRAGATRPLADRIEMGSQPSNVERRLAAPSIFDFLQEGDGGRDVGPFVPPPRRSGTYWMLNLMEHERSPAMMRFQERMQQGGSSDPVQGLIDDAARHLEYAERRGMAFMTAGLFPAAMVSENRGEVTIPRGDVEAHIVPLEYRLSSDTPDGQVLYIWARGVRLVLSRPHARAALGMGGLLWRIARWAGLTPEHAREGPTREAREEGSTRFIVQGASDGPMVMTDDWLSQEEVDTLLGVQVGSSRALWPDPELLRHNWWQGEWTDQHELWFLDWLTTLLSMRGVGIARTHAQWRAYIRNRDYAAQARGATAETTTGNAAPEALLWGAV